MLLRSSVVASVKAARRALLLVLAVAGSQLIGGQTASAQSWFTADADSLPSGGGYQMRKNTFYGGGSADPSTGGNFSARSSFGQPAAGTVSGGTFQVRGGFSPAPTPAAPTQVPGVEPYGLMVVGLASAIAAARAIRRRSLQEE
jgi:hypothetical protein